MCLCSYPESGFLASTSGFCTCLIVEGFAFCATVFVDLQHGLMGGSPGDPQGGEGRGLVPVTRAAIPRCHPQAQAGPLS